MESALDRTETKDMTFVGGVARLRSAARNLQCWPAGGPRREIVRGDGGFPQAIPVSGPEVNFIDHCYNTEEQAVALALCSDKRKFEPAGQWGWRLDPSCVPPSLAGTYNRVGRVAKRKIAMQLCQGVSSPQILESLTDEDMKPIVDAKNDDGGSYEIPCMGKNCRASFKATGPDRRKEVLEALNKHLTDSHPDWSAKTASA